MNMSSEAIATTTPFPSLALIGLPLAFQLAAAVPAIVPEGMWLILVLSIWASLTMGMWLIFALGAFVWSTVRRYRASRLRTCLPLAVWRRG
jgi:hypothetical protein